jgi:RimJ/RimL family protein N-acetyltransferase
MSESKERVPDKTLEILARNFFRESVEYGFQRVDYIRFTNMLFDLSMDDREMAGEKKQETQSPPVPKQTKFPLKGERIWIRAPKPKIDESLLKQWLSDEFGRYFLLSRTTAESITFSQLIKGPSHIVGLIIFPDGTPVGAVAFLNHDTNQHKAELRKLIGDPNMRGMGLAKEATRLWIQYGLSALKLRKIYVNTLNTNLHNIRLNEEVGFKVEGLLRNEVFIDGQYKDVLRMGLWLESPDSE